MTTHSASLMAESNLDVGWRPKCLDIDPSSPKTEKEWHHYWRTVFTNYVEDYEENNPNMPDNLCQQSSIRV